MQHDSPATRREFLGLAGSALAATTLGLASSESAHAKVVAFETKMDFKNPKWNRDAYARLQGDLDIGKPRYSWIGGPVMAVVPNQKIQPLFYMDGISCCRFMEIEGGYRKLLREVVLYKDYATREILEEWKNPYLDGEVVKVVPIANDPFNYNITEYYPDPPSFGGLNKEKPPKRPLLLDWSIVNNTLLLTTDIHLYYPNALQPDKWPRESAGPLVQVTELYRYHIRLEDMKNPKLTQVPCTGNWGRVTPWLPWMLMGTKPGHCLYNTDFAGGPSWDVVPERSKDVLKYVEKHYPQYLTAPEKDYGPSLSSLENYAKNQKPAPVK